MKLITIRFITALIILSAVSTVGLHASVDNHEHEHKNHHPHAEEQKENDHHEHNDYKSNIDDEDTHHDEHDDKEIRLDDKTIAEFGIKLNKAKSGWIKKTKLFPGEVSIHLDYLAHVTPRFPGVVKKIYRHIGDEVKAGDVLAIIESNDSLTPYKMTSPISGTVIDKHFTLGESVEENSHAFEIANLNTVWIQFSIFQDKFGEISKGQKAIIQSSNGKHTVQGTISYISPTVDEHTRTQMGRIVLSNKQHNWKPGMFVDVNVVFSKVKGQVVVPNTAIQKIDNQPVVFVQEKHEFKPYSVQLGDYDESHTIIISGIESDQIYVSDGGFILKSELEKGSMGHGHAH